MNNTDSLRKQLINALDKKGGNISYTSEEIFDDALWPVLDAAMKAGELLVHRATTPQKPVADALVEWLEQSLPILREALSEQATVSKAQAMKIISQIMDNGTMALIEAKRISGNAE